MRLQRAQAASILRQIVIIKEGSSKLEVLSDLSPVDLFNVTGGRFSS